MSDRLCVVMPVYNEEDAVGAVLEKWDAVLKALGADYVIRPYNDGSRDGSLEVMRRVAARLGPQIDVRDKPNGGHGNTILTGYRDAAADGFDWVFQIDSDNEMGPEKFGELWSRRGEYDFLVGIRDGRRQALPRKVMSLVSRLCVRCFYGKGVWDVNTPYRLMRVSAFREFFLQVPLTTFAPNVILSGLAARHRLRLFETRVPQRDRTTGEISIRKLRLVKAAAKSFCQTVAFSLDSRRGWLVFSFLALLSIELRFFASGRGWNYDFESYEIVANIVKAGGNVYAETFRYNYGPIWFLVLGALKTLFGPAFRLGIVLLLSLADVGIAMMLWRKKFFLPSCIFLLSNISIHITGFHNQFDNLAVCVALVALLILDKAKSGEGRWRFWAGIALLGVSITIKHVFVFMPFWLLFRDGPRRRRIVCCMLPIAIFILSFVPYSGIGNLEQSRQMLCSFSKVPEYVNHSRTVRDGIKQFYRENVKQLMSPTFGIYGNVFMYRSFQNGTFYRCFVPNAIRRRVPDTFLFVAAMMTLGFVVRRRNLFFCGLIYTLGMFVFSSAIAMQYYAIPCVAAAVYWMPFGLLYHIGAGLACFCHSGWVLMHPMVRISAMLMAMGCLVVALRSEIAMSIRNAVSWLSRRLCR